MKLEQVQAVDKEFADFQAQGGKEDESPEISVRRSKLNIELMDNHEITEKTEENASLYEEVEVLKPKKLWLKYNIGDGIIHDAVKKILSDYNGIDEVYVKDTGTNQAFKMNTLVTIRESLLFELKTILPEENIFIQE